MSAISTILNVSSTMLLGLSKGVGAGEGRADVAREGDCEGAAVSGRVAFLKRSTPR